MSKFNTTARRTGATSVISTVSRTPNVRNFEGAAGYSRDARSELFQLAVTNFVSEKTFYETANARDERFERLVAEVAVTDVEAKWLIGFGRWLRTEVNMRSASLVLAAEAVRTRLENGIEGGNRQLIDAVLQRADEPGEMLAYWVGRYGDAIPKPVKRGVADAAVRLYSQRTFLKYGNEDPEYSFSRVLWVTHPEAKAAWQETLFKYILNKRFNSKTPIPAELEMVTANVKMRSKSPDKIRKWAANGKLVDKLAEAGLNWEDVPALVDGPWTAELWESIIPAMGVGALTKNLRNFDTNRVSNVVAETVGKALTDPEAVKRSRLLPMRFLSAHRAAPSARWAWPLEQALDLSMQNIPELKGRTLILVDTSSSMRAGFSARSELKRWDAAVLFGLAISQRCENVDVVSYSSSQVYYEDPFGPNTKVFGTVAGETTLKAVERWNRNGYFLGGGTDTAGALKKHYAGHDRVIILTDEHDQPKLLQVTNAMPQNRPLYTFNLLGYPVAFAPFGTPNRHEFGGLTDDMLKLIPMLEGRARKVAKWPWEL